MKKLISQYYASSQIADVHFGPPADADSITRLKNIHPSFPADLIAVYQECNGFGVKEGDEVEWLLMPIEKLQDFVANCRSTWEETHPLMASKFVPVFDWGNGDVSGYLPLEIAPANTIYTWDHELYEYDAAQDWREFLVETESSIEDLLSVVSDEDIAALGARRFQSDDWHEIVERFIAGEVTDLELKEYEIISGSVKTREEIKQVEKAWQCQLPEEFYSFYMLYNGFGLQSNQMEKPIWYVLPLEKLETLKNEFDAKVLKYGKTFEGEFYPFIDSESIDELAGYLVSSAGDCQIYVNNPEENIERIAAGTSKGISIRKYYSSKFVSMFT